MPDTPDVGDPAPDFSLPSTQGAIRLAERLKQGAVLLVFYPGDDTPVCTKQLCDYRDNLAVFRDLGVDVLGVNPQPLASHQAFADKFSLPFPLAADEDKSVCRAYGTLSFLGYAQRALVLVGRDGKVKYKRSDFPMFRRSADELRKVISELSL
ncbi:MAG: peroxiredoxin [Candidatus Binatia bacterium]